MVIGPGGRRPPPPDAACHSGVVRPGRWLDVVTAVAALTALTALTACGGVPAAAPPAGSSTTPPTPTPTMAATPGTTTAAPTTARPSTAPPPTAPTAQSAPAWTVGAHPLPLRPDGFGQVLPTPPVLVNRRLPTADLLTPPPGTGFVSSVRPVPADVLARSTWQPACPVTVTQLRYVTVSFWGFDGGHHTGELLLNASVADAVAGVFATLHAARYPIEEMRVTAAAELDLHPTGDGNNTGAFVCRPARGQSRWSAHAYGLAVDVNPFCNPYTRGDLVLPELASAYTDRAAVRPGMIRAGDVVVRAFAAIGWTWGGTWSSPRDLMHFSSTGG
jgi:hypothetical protein